MKRSKIALITSGCLAIAPVAAIATGIATSCGKKDDPGISVSTKDVEINHNTGVGSFDVILDEQPVDNVAYVYIITAEGPHHVELLDNDNDVYNGHPAVLYGVQNGIAHVKIGFTEFVGETTKTVVGLEVRYNNRKGEWILKHINGINLTATYVHNPTEEIHIFSLNDLHGVAEGYGESKNDFPSINVKDPGVIRIMNTISPIIDSHPGSFLVTAGDNNSGDMFSTSVHGISIYHMLQSMGARYSAVGNHAFEWGITPMATLQFDEWARTPDTMGNYFLASNILNGKLDDKKTWETDPTEKAFKEDYAFWKSQRVVWADPYKIVNMNGHLVCLIGLTTKSTLSDGNRSVVDNLSFIDYNAALDYSIYECQQEVAPQLFNCIESFIPLTHVGCGAENADGSNPTGEAADFAKEISHPKVDAVITGHSHSLVNGTVYNSTISKDILIGQAETEGRKYLDLSFYFDNSKPMGQQLTHVTQKVCDMGMSRFKDWDEANKDLTYIKDHPSTPTVAAVVGKFRDECVGVFKALNTKIAHREDSLLYPGVEAEETPKGIGHDYFINQYVQKDVEPKHGGYIFDQLGAWVARAMILGFGSLFNEDIIESPKGLTYPAVGMINQDSMKIQYDKVESKDVLLKDMYNIQTYENTTLFGYFDIWQLASMLNHSLSGGEYRKDGQGNPEYRFNYYDLSGVGNYYTPTKENPPSDYPTPTPNNSIDNMSRFYLTKNHAENDPYIDTCLPNEFKDLGNDKGLNHIFCVCPCGPVQMYGIKFGVTQATAEETAESGRKWKVALVETQDPTLKLTIPAFPDLYILDPKDDPRTGESVVDPIYSTINDPAGWKSAEQWYLDYGGMVPVVTNNFLFDGANYETPMAQVYMNHNQNKDFTSYPILKYSQITRDLLVEFCNLTTTRSDINFDMPLSIVKQLVAYNWES